ncbi:MAG: C39 family peptidase [Methylococcaceae bacterium]|nr:C39 family peptidase [Methylococcaceae bacterium]
MKQIRHVLIFIFFLLLLVGCGNLSGNSALNISRRNETKFVKRHTVMELRHLHVIKQELDYSCGAAALATLMRNYFGDDTSEKEILALLDIWIKDLPEKEKKRKKQDGFSLLDLKAVANLKGYQAAGFRLTLDQLRKLNTPVIVFVKPLGYHHFAVLRGVTEDRVFLADPTRGNLRLNTARFLEEYGGIVFVLGKDGEELIKAYKLALSRPDDYVLPDQRRTINRISHFQNYTSNLMVRSRPLRPQTR